MALSVDIAKIAMQVSRGVVVASIQVDLDEAVLVRFREDLLSRIHETNSRGAILDVSGLGILDSEELAALRRIIAMTELMGARSVLVGLRPGVVSALVEAEADIDGLEVAVDLDAAFDLLAQDLEGDYDLQIDAESGTDGADDGAEPEPSPDAPEVEW